MLFNSIEYLFIFLPTVFIVYFLFNKFKFYNAAKIFLLISSLYFYGSYKWDYLYIITVSILVNYGISVILRQNIQKNYKKLILIAAIASNTFVLMFFKYFDFLANALSKIDFNYLNTMKIVLPLGISFFMLQQMSYLIDVYKGDIKKYSLLDYALFVCFFPQLIAGPIVRHSEMIPQFNNLKNRIVNQDNIYIGLFLITAGLLKKTVFADGFIPFIDYMTQYKIFSDFYIAWLLGITKVLHGYFDFSAYCDLALGSAFLFNISLPWNFNSPFQAENITDFWKHWNMTLMRFLRIYIYMPLGGTSHNGRNLPSVRTYANILIVFTIMGIWTALSPMCILYGLSNGVCICINKFWQSLKIKINEYMAKMLTLLTIILTSQFLFSHSLNESIRIIKSMFSIDASHTKLFLEGTNLSFMAVPPLKVNLNVILLILSLLIVLFAPNSNILAKKYAKSNNFIYTIILVIAFIFGVLSITKESEFIYFVF